MEVEDLGPADVGSLQRAPAAQSQPEQAPQEPRDPRTLSVQPKGIIRGALEKTAEGVGALAGKANEVRQKIPAAIRPGGTADLLEPVGKAIDSKIEGFQQGLMPESAARFNKLVQQYGADIPPEEYLSADEIEELLAHGESVRGSLPPELRQILRRMLAGQSSPQVAQQGALQ